MHQEVADHPQTPPHLFLVEACPACGHHVLGDADSEAAIPEQIADQTGTSDLSLVVGGASLEGEAQVVLFRTFSGKRFDIGEVETESVQVTAREGSPD